MASSKKTMSKCVTCTQNSDEHKAKPGISLCEGCNQSFCLSHFVEHRQALNNKLDGIAEQRDVLRSRIVELPTRMSKEHFKTIDDWKNTMLQTVTEAANNAQQQVHQLIIDEMERECEELTSKITTFRDNDNCVETDLCELQTKTEKINEELNDLPNLHRIQLNLPTLDCSKMVHIKSLDTNVVSEIVENNDAVILKPQEEYRSFIECFLTTHQPLTDIKTNIWGYTCVAPTMLIDIQNPNIMRLVFHRNSTSTFEYGLESPLAVRWSFWLQQFIILTSEKIMVVDAVEKDIKNVMQKSNARLRYTAHWKHRCLIADEANRMYLYEMNKNLTDWLLLYCWSPPTTCTPSEQITAIGLNEHHIVLSAQLSGYPYRFAVHKYDMTPCSNIDLTYSCTTIQAPPYGQWLLYDAYKNLYYAIDSDLKQHDETYLSSLKDLELIISCDETDKILLVLQPYSCYGSTEFRVYTSNC